MIKLELECKICGKEAYTSAEGLCQDCYDKTYRPWVKHLEEKEKTPKIQSTAHYMKLAQRTSNAEAGLPKLINAGLGLAGEAGEFADHVKKAVYQGHDIDVEYLVDELGDILWYIVEAATALETDLDTVMTRNIKKLEARYPGGKFEEKLSREREA